MVARCGIAGRGGGGAVETSCSAPWPTERHPGTGRQHQLMPGIEVLMPPISGSRKRALLAVTGVAMLVGGVLAPVTSAQAAGTGPCDIYASGGTPCVAAHSTTRALYGSYTGPLYQVRRSSDNTYRSITPVSAGGYADSA